MAGTTVCGGSVHWFGDIPRRVPLVDLYVCLCVRLPTLNTPNYTHYTQQTTYVYSRISLCEDNKKQQKLTKSKHYIRVEVRS